MSKTMEDVFDLAEKQILFEQELSQRAGQILALITIAQVHHMELSPAVQTLRRSLQSFQQWHSAGTEETASPTQSMF